MKFWDAFDRFVAYYQDQDTKEIPVILSFYDFKNKTILDVGSGTGRLALKFASVAEKVFCLDKDEGALQTIKDKTGDDLAEKIETVVGSSVKIPFPENRFDASYSAWTLQSTDFERTLKEMMRVSKDAVIIVLDSGDEDEANLRAIYDHGEIRKRKERTERIKTVLREADFSVKERRMALNFDFPNAEEAYEILHEITFGGKELPENVVRKIKEFLNERKTGGGRIKFTQGAAFICGYRRYKKEVIL